MVKGQVRYKGEPAEGATVYFHRKGGEVAMGGGIPAAVVDKDGTFRLASAEWDGAAAGAYDVLVEWRDRRQVPPAAAQGAPKPAGRGGRKKGVRPASQIRSSPSLPADRLLGRYADLGRPRLKAEVKPEANNLAPFDLTD